MSSFIRSFRAPEKSHIPIFNDIVAYWGTHFIIRWNKEVPVTQPRLLDRVREEMRLRHYSLRTEKTYSEWIKRFILFHDKRHPSGMGETEITAFLTWLATDRKVAASTQNQALPVLLFLYKAVLGVELDWMDGIVRARRPVRVPVVLTKDEVRAVLSMMKGTNKLLAWLLYGTGMRVSEALQLRVLDIDFGERLRHPHRAGTARPQGCEDDPDLHPCAEPRRARGAQPARPLSRIVARRRGGCYGLAAAPEA